VEACVCDARHQYSDRARAERWMGVHVVPRLQLTGDLQIIRPTRSTADTAIVPGVRLRIVF
jgi:carbohydrate-selective porin OprB